MSTASQAIFENNAPSMGLAGSALSHMAANDNGEQSASIPTHSNMRVQSPGVVGNDSNLALRNIAKILNSIDSTLKDQLDIVEQEETHQRESFLERPRIANDNHPSKDLQSANDNHSKIGLAGVVATGEIVAMVSAALPEILAVLGIAGGVAALKMLYDKVTGTADDNTPVPYTPDANDRSQAPKPKIGSFDAQDHFPGAALEYLDAPTNPEPGQHSKGPKQSFKQLRGRAAQRKAYFADAARRAGVNGQELVQMLAQSDEETGQFSQMTESLDYPSVARIKKVFKRLRGRSDAELQPFVHNSVGLANLAYSNKRDLGNRGGNDGYDFRGRGPLQITGRDAYRRVGQQINVDLEHNPQLLDDPDISNAATIAYWKMDIRPRVLKKLGGDFSNTGRISRMLNGGTNGIEERFRRIGPNEQYVANLPALGAKPPKPDQRDTPQVVWPKIAPTKPRHIVTEGLGKVPAWPAPLVPNNSSKPAPVSTPPRRSQDTSTPQPSPSRPGSKVDYNWYFLKYNK